MKKKDFVTPSIEWDEYQNKVDFIQHVISKSLSLEVSQFNTVKIAEAQALNIPVIAQTPYYIVANYNDAYTNVDVDQGLLYKEKVDATIDYILGDSCIYEQFVENWGPIPWE